MNHSCIAKIFICGVVLPFGICVFFIPDVLLFYVVLIFIVFILMSLLIRATILVTFAIVFLIPMVTWKLLAQILSVGCFFRKNDIHCRTISDRSKTVGRYEYCNTARPFIAILINWSGMLLRKSMPSELVCDELLYYLLGLTEISLV